jgi:protein SCO1/2
MALITAAICVAGALVGVLLASRPSDDAAAKLPADAWAGAVRPPGSGLPPFQLTDQDGKRVTEESVRGRPAIFAFIYSHCQDTCPSEVQTIRGALDAYGHDLPVYGVSVDPANDTRRSAQAFLLEQKMKGRMEFLLGNRAHLQGLWSAFGIAPQAKGKEHSAYVVLVDRQSRQRVGFPFDQLTQAGLAHDLARLDRVA